MDRIGGYYAECNKSEKDKYCMISLICGNTKIQQTSEYDKKKSRRRYREQTSGYQWGEGIGEEQYRGEGVIYKLIYKINCKDIFYNTENIVNIL